MWLPSSGTKGFLQNLEMRRYGVFVVCFSNAFQQEHWLSKWLWPSEKVPNQPWTKSSRFMSWSVGKMTSRYSRLFNCCHHHCTIACPTHVLAQSSHLPHFPVTKKEWTMYGNRYITPMPFQGWWSAKNFTKPVWSEQETNRIGKKIFHKLCPPDAPSFWVIYWKVSATLQISGEPWKCLTFHSATRKATLHYPCKYPCATNPYPPVQIMASGFFSLTSFEYQDVFKALHCTLCLQT